MATTQYHTIRGRIRGMTSSGSRVDLLTDPIGSVVSSVSSDGNILNTYRSNPYGGILEKTGADADPHFIWTGESGSRTTGLPIPTHFNRARHYSAGTAQWLVADPFVANLRLPYVYCSGNPTTRIDPFGLDENLGGQGQVQICTALAPTLVVRERRQECWLNALGTYSVHVYVEVEIRCLTLSYSRNAGASGSIPQWIKSARVSYPGATPPFDKLTIKKEEYDADMMNPCRKRPGGNPIYAGYQWPGLHYHQYFGLDAPGTDFITYDPTLGGEEIVYPDDCRSFKKYSIGLKLDLSKGPYEYEAHFLTCCSCGRSPGHGSPMPKGDAAKACKEWGLKIKIASVSVGPPECSLNTFGL